LRRAKGEPEAIGKLVPKVLHELGFDASARVVRVAERWEEAVGPEIASHCQPTALREDRLEVSVDSSAWCQQLQLQAPEILAALQRVLGDDAPSALWFHLS
jgi:predicted nucleic acid-binding Zn ribbon protein